MVGGEEDWVVHCSCGTRDDDGERMVACERCSKWSHTRCIGVHDELPPPDGFVCPPCRRAGGRVKTRNSGRFAGRGRGRGRWGERNVAVIPEGDEAAADQVTRNPPDGGTGNAVADTQAVSECISLGLAGTELVETAAEPPVAEVRTAVDLTPQLTSEVADADAVQVDAIFHVDALPQSAAPLEVVPEESLAAELPLVVVEDTVAVE